MRRTVTLDPDAELLLRRAMRERSLTFKEAINEAIRAGLADSRGRAAVAFATYDMGQPRIDLTKALQLAGELEDQTLARKLSDDR
jgi:hypothetical protein